MLMALDLLPAWQEVLTYRTIFLSTDMDQRNPCSIAATHTSVRIAPGAYYHLLPTNSNEAVIFYVLRVFQRIDDLIQSIR
jgi:hypothetical protein